MVNNNEMIEQAAREAMQPRLIQHQPAPQPQQFTINLNELVTLGVLTPEQVFNMLFKNQAPTEFEGTK